MATPLTYQNTLPLSCDHYIEQYFNADAVRYFARHMVIDEYKLEMLKDEGPLQMRTIRVAPKLDIPWWVARMMGAKRISYLETTTHKTGSNVLEWSILSSVFTEKIDIKGKIVLEAGEAADQCHYTLTGEVDIRMYGWGSRLEAVIAESTLEGCAVSHELTLLYHKGQIAKRG